MIVNQEQETTQEGKKKLDIKKAYAYFTSKSEESKFDVDENNLRKLVLSEDLASTILTWHKRNGIGRKGPKSIKEAQALVNSWMVPDVVEKKNQNSNNIEQPIRSLNLESLSIGEKPDTTSDGANTIELTKDDLLKAEESSIDDMLIEQSKSSIFRNVVERNPTVYSGTPRVAKDNSILENTNTGFTPITKKGDSLVFDDSKLLTNVIEQIPENILNKDVSFLKSSESEVQKELQNTLSAFGYKIEQDEVFKNAIKITTPDQRVETFKIKGSSYSAQLMEQGETEESIQKIYTEDYNELISFLSQSPEINLVDNFAEKMSKTNDIYKDVKNSVRTISSSLSYKDLQRVGSLIGKTPSDYLVNHAFDSEQIIKDIKKIKNKLNSSVYKQKINNSLQDAYEEERDGQELINLPKGIGEDKNKINRFISTFNFLDGIIKELRFKQSIASSLTGAALNVSGGYDEINLFDIDKIKDMVNQGFSLSDLPTNGIKINDIPSTFNFLSDILTDPNGRNDVIRGRIKVEIDENHEGYGALSFYIKQAKDLQIRNEAFKKESAFSAESKIFSEYLEDAVQGIIISTGDMYTDFGSALSDLIQIAGVDKYTADQYVFANNLMDFAKPIRPIDMKYVRESSLPLYKTNISDSDSFAEFLALLNEPLTRSIPYFGLFAINPTLGLSATGVTTYGRTVEDLKSQRDVVLSLYKKGVTLTESEEKIMKLSDNEARIIALTQATSETAITGLFTFRYFNSMNAARNFAGPKTVENANKIATAYAKIHNRSIRQKISNFLGISYHALAVEVPEEELIVLMDYLIKRAWGITEEKSNEELKTMFKDTGLIAFASSGAMSKIAKYNQNKQINKVVDNVVKNNITFQGETKLIKEHIKNEAELAKQQNYLQEEGLDVTEADLSQVRESGIRLNAVNKRKIEIVDAMNIQQKQSFLESITRLELAKQNFKDIRKSNNTRREALNNVKKEQKILLDLITTTPTEASYFFLPGSLKLKFEEQAMKEIMRQKEEEGVDNYNISAEEATKKAANNFVESLKKIERDDTLKVLPAESYTVLDPNSVMAPVNLPEVQEGEALYDLNKEINQVYTKRKKQIKQPTLFEQDPIGVNEAMSREDISETQKDIELDFTRVDEVIVKIENLNKDNDFIFQLPIKQQEVIKDFFQDLKNNKQPKLGKVESVVDAQIDANKTASQVDGKIKIFDYGKIKLKDIWNSSESLRSQIYKKINAASQSRFTAKIGFGTADINLQMLFRNSDVGKKAFDRWSSITTKQSAAEQKIDKEYNSFMSFWKKIVKKHNKGIPSGIFKKGTVDTNPNSLQNSYDMTFLSGAYRRHGVTNDNGVDVAFANWKNHLKEVAEQRRQAIEDVGLKNKTQKALYKLWMDTYNKFGFEEANRFEDLNVKPYQLEALDFLAKIQPHDRAMKRVLDFGGRLDNKELGIKTPFVKGTYLPVNYTSDAGLSTKTKTPNDNTNSQHNIVDSSNLMRNTASFNLGENVTISPGAWAKNFFNMMKGAEIDISVRQDMTTFQYMLDNPSFENIFENKNDYSIIRNYFKLKNEELNNMVKKGNVKIDYNSRSWFDTGKKAVNSALSLIAADALTSIAQPAAQFYSAVFSSYGYLNHPKAKNHLTNKLVAFTVGLSSTVNGAPKKYSWQKYLNKQLNGTPELSNIYSNSRTGLRNSLKAEYALTDQAKIPFSYYLKSLNLKESDFKGVESSLMLTVDGFLNILKVSAETSLNVWLVHADRAAANAAFESHYINARAEQGFDFKNINMADWWKKENENPNTDAIFAADKIIARQMRQTGLGEAKIYSSTQNLIKTSIQTLFAFQKFVTNARANFANQYAIIKDKTIPFEQKKQAEKAMTGIVMEVLSFGAIKQASRIARISGITGFLFGLEDEDVVREGGYTQMIGRILPIEDRTYTLSRADEKKYQDALSNSGFEFKETVEGMVLKNNIDYARVSIDEANLIIGKYAMEYENRFKAGGKFPIVTTQIVDLLSTIKPIGVPDLAEDTALFLINKFLDEEVFTEFVGQDLMKARTKGGLADFGINNAGIYSIGIEKFNKLREASDLYKEQKNLTYAGEYGVVENYIFKGFNEPQLKKISTAIDLLYYLRVSSSFTPYIPKAEVNFFTTLLQRAIENEFRGGKKDE